MSFATVFWGRALLVLLFLMLVPAMKELVKIIDRRVRIQLGLIEPTDEQRGPEINT